MGDIPELGAAKRLEVHKTMEIEGAAVNCPIPIAPPTQT
jgi:hypothetical protein